MASFFRIQTAAVRFSEDGAGGQSRTGTPFANRFWISVSTWLKFHLLPDFKSRRVGERSWMRLACRGHPSDLHAIAR